MGAGIRALNKRAWQHSLGWAVVWRDAATAATLRAKTPLEQACASLLRAEAIALAATPHGPAGPTAVLSAALLEGVLP